MRNQRMRNQRTAIYMVGAIVVALLVIYFAGN